MRNYKKYNVWKKSHELTLLIYKAVNRFPKEEIYGLASQMKRSTSSIPMNIAEGCGRNSDKDFCRFLYIAFGSANELEYQLLLCIDLKFIEKKEGDLLTIKLQEVKKMLNGLINKIQANS